jgi:hypothetical protein
LSIEAPIPSQLRLIHDGKELAGRVVTGKSQESALVVALGDVKPGEWIGIETRVEGPIWFRLAGVRDEERWICTTRSDGPTPPSQLVGRRARPTADPTQRFVPGKFGQGLLLVPGRELHIPDEVVDADGTKRRLSDQKQGTIEFWMRRLTDDRVMNSRPWMILDNGPVFVISPAKLPLDEWVHVAVVWRPVKDLPELSLVHIYVDGRDHATYRNLYWEGYAAPPQFSGRQPWKREFVVWAPPGGQYVIDDVRISSAPRYADLSLEFGSRQAFNPVSFPAPAEAAGFDDRTVLQLPLDGSLGGMTAGRRAIEATLVLEKPPK